MKIEYHKPTIGDNKRRAGFWLAIGSLTSSVVFFHLFAIALALIIAFIFFMKLIVLILKLSC